MTTNTDRPLRWEETKDQHGNSTYRALSHTYGDANQNPLYSWEVKCVLRDNEAVWSIESSSPGLLFEASVGRPEPAGTGYYSSADASMFSCQSLENYLRAKLGEGLPPPPQPEPETPPLVLTDDGLAPTTIVRAKWSPNGGALRMFRVWKQPGTELEQERQITDRDEEEHAMAAFFTQKMVEELVTRLSTGGFGRLLWETPFATAFMQAELDFTNVSAFTVTIRRGDGTVTELPVKPPTHDAIMKIVARQMHERRQQLENSIGTVDERELVREIGRNAKSLGLEVGDLLGSLATEGGNVLPVTLEDIQAGGGNIFNPGQK